MAYGQGMIRDSIQNILNRRMQRGQEQDRGDLMERLRMQADMQTAKDAADNEWRMRHQLLVNKGNLDVANAQVGGRLGVEDKRHDTTIEKQGMMNQGFEKSQRLKNEGAKMVQDLVNSGQLEKAVTLQQMIDRQKGLDRESNEGIQGRHDDTDIKVAQIGATTKRYSTDAQFGQGGSRARLEVYKSLRKMAQDSRVMRQQLETQKAKGIAGSQLQSQARRAEESANQMIKELSGGQATSVGVPFLHPDYAAKVDEIADRMMQNDPGLRNESQNQGRVTRQGSSQPAYPEAVEQQEGSGGFFVR